MKVPDGRGPAATAPPPSVSEVTCVSLPMRGLDGVSTAGRETRVGSAYENICDSLVASRSTVMRPVKLKNDAGRVPFKPVNDKSRFCKLSSGTSPHCRA